VRDDQISLQLYTLREHTARDMPGTLRRLAKIGYAAVELAGFGGLSPQELRRTLDDLGLCASGAHVPSTRGRRARDPSSPTCTSLAPPTPSFR